MIREDTLYRFRYQTLRMMHRYKLCWGCRQLISSGIPPVDTCMARMP